MRNQLLGLYGNAVITLDSMTPQQQLAAYHVGMKAADDDILVQLLGRPDLDTEVETLLLGHKSARVIAAWFSRVGRNVEDVERQVKREKRIGVLESIAAQPAMSDVVYEVCAQSNHARVAAVLIDNDDVPQAFRRSAARTLAKNYTAAPFKKRCHIDRMFDKYPEFAEDVAACATDLTLLGQVVRHGTVTQRTGDMLVRRFATEIPGLVTVGLVSMTRHSYSHASSITLDRINMVVTSLAEHGGVSELVIDDFAEAVSSLLKKTDDPFAKWDDREVSDAARVHYSARLLRLLEAAGTTATGEVPPAVRFRRAGTDEINELLEQFAGLNYEERTKSAYAVIENPASTAAQIAKVASHASARNLMQLLAGRIGDHDAILAVTGSRGYLRITDNELQRLSPDNTKQLWLDLVRQACSANDLYSVVLLLKSGYYDESIICELPLAVFLSMELPTRVTAAAMSLIEETINGDADVNDQFHALSQNFSGPLGVLCKSARAQAQLSRLSRRDT